MPQIFHRRSNALVGALLMLTAVAAVGGTVVAYALARSDYATGQNTAPEQPVPFSHKHHVGGLGIDCGYCHTSTDKSQFAGIPATHTCMTCHSQLWTNAEMLAPVRKSLETGQPLRWERVHDLADYVYFNHSAHVTNGVGCESCHGRVDQMPLMTQEKPLTMQWCLSCHRNPEPNLRPADKITAMGYEPGADGIAGDALLAHYGINKTRLTDCVTCHR